MQREKARGGANNCKKGVLCKSASQNGEPDESSTICAADASEVCLQKLKKKNFCLVFIAV